MSRDLVRHGDERGSRINRRKWLKALGVTGTVGLAGCLGGGTGGNGSGDGNGSGGGGGGGGGQNQSNQSQQGGIPSVGGTYRTITTAEPSTLNPLYNSESGAGTLIGYTLDLGYDFMPETKYFPQTYELSTDKSQVWVANLREGMKFSGDYGKVTAEDFVYQITQVQQSEWAGTADTSSWPSEINVEQTGELEFQIELPNPNALYPETLDPLLYPIPKKLMQPYVDAQDAQGFRKDKELLNLSFTGNVGAYTLENRNRGNSLTFARNDEYYLRDAEGVPKDFSKAPYFENLEVQIVKEQAARVAALKTGETDSAAVPPNQMETIKKKNGIETYVIPQPYTEVCCYNMRDNGWNTGPGNLFRKKKFRQGLACSVNKKKLAKGVFRNFADPVFTWQPNWSRWYPEDTSEIEQYGVGDLYGKKPARSRIKEAIADTDYGYSGDMLKNPSGETCELSLYVIAGDQTDQAMAQYLAQEYEKNAGIKIAVETIQGTQFTKEYWQQQIPDNPKQYPWSNGPNNAGPREVTSAQPWDMEIVFGLNTYPLNPTTANVFFIKDSAYNPYGYYPSWNADKLFEKASSATSEKKLQSIFNEIFAKINEDQPFNMLVFPADTVGYSADIEGPIENFFNEWDFSTWYRSG